MVAADDIPFSPAKETPMVAIQFTWKRMHGEVVAAVPEIERVLKSYRAKPHFGKIFVMD